MKKFAFFVTVLSFTLFAEEPTILFEADPTSLVSEINAVMLFGSAQDPIDQVGLSNLLGELMLRGTKKRSRSKFQIELEQMGASLTVKTGQDIMVFDGKVIKENTAAFLKLIEDCLMHPALLKGEFEDLKRELISEAEHMKNSNNRLGGLTARKELFAGTSLERPVSGSVSTLKKIQLEDVVKAYNNRFHRASIVFGVASSLKEEELKKSLTAVWKQLPDGAKQSRKSVAPKVPEKPKLIVIHKPKTSTGSMLFAQAGITAQDPLRYALNTGNFSFGAEPLVSRLFKTVRGELGWTYAIGTTYNATGGLSYQQGIYVISSTPSVEFTSKTLFKQLAMWKSYLEDGLESDELKLARESLINSYPFEFESAEKRLAQRLNSLINGVPILSPEEYEKTIGAIGNKEVKKALKERHTTDGWLIALVADKDIVAKQLEEEQKEIAPEKRLTISKVVTPDEVVD